MYIHNLALLAGIWRATLTLPGGELPFNFYVSEKNNLYQIEIINGEERIVADEIKFENDSVFIRLPVFDSEIRAKVLNKKLAGNWINYSRKNNQQIIFEAEFGKKFRFVENPGLARINCTGRWETWFSPATADSNFAVGIFNQNNTHLSGTFLTPTGDYRFLEGNVAGDSIFLSCFDGSHAYLFKAKLFDDNIEGMFYSGNHWKEKWIAFRNEKAELPDATIMTKMKDGSDKIYFKLKDIYGSDFQFPDKRYDGKVTVIQIMGSWCPNCMDETAFLAPFYDRYKSKGFEVISLAFEKTDDFIKAVSNVQRLKEKYNIKYPLIIAGNRDRASETMNMLDKVHGYPTTIFIDKKGKVRKIETGFTGPATGKYYEKYKDGFEDYIRALLGE